MANTATRLSANGSLTINGTFDEVTGPISKNGLIGYWDIQYPYSSNTNYWFDQSGSNNHIQLISGATQTTGNINFFVANSSYGLTTVPQLAGASIITIECVAKASLATVGMLFGFNGYDIYHNGGYFGYNTANSDIYGFSPAQVSSLGLNGNYKHYVFVMTATGNITTLNEIWINGVKQILSQQLGTTTVAPGFNKNGPYYLILNGWDAAGSYKLNSSFANFKIYNRQLTSKEIVQNYNVYAPRFGFTSIGTNPVNTLIANNISQTATQVITGEFDEVTYNPNNIGPTKNMFSNSEDFTQQLTWNNVALSFTKNYATAPDGKQTATLVTGTGQFPRIMYWHPGGGYNFGAFGKTYTQSLFVKYVNQRYCTFVTESWPSYNGAAIFDILYGVTAGYYALSMLGSSIQKFDNGWYRISVTYLVPTLANYYWQPQWRLGNYDGTDYTGQSMLVWGAQLEEGNTATTYVSTGFPKNLLQFTKDFKNNWYKENCNVTNNATIDPDGNYTGSLLTSTISGGFNTAFTHQVISSLPLNTNYTYSVYLKQGTSPTTYINFYNVSPYSDLFTVITWPTIPGNAPTISYTGSAPRLNATITPSNNGWWRFSLSLNNGSSSALICRIYTTNTTAVNVPGYSVYIWGPQLEFGLTPTPYIENGGMFTNILPASNTNMLMKTTNIGNTYIKNTYDEYSKMSPITEGLIFNVDPGYDSSYNPNNNVSTMYDTTQNRYKVDLSTAGSNVATYSSDYGGILKFTGTYGNNAWANTNIPTRIITPTSNYTMSAWIKFNTTNNGLAESNWRDPATGVYPLSSNTGYSYGSGGTILGTSYYGDYGLYWYFRVINGVKDIILGFQNRVVPYNESSPQIEVAINANLFYYNWFHMVGVLNSSGNFAGLYINGVLINSTTASQIAGGSFPYSYPTIRIFSDGIAGGNAYGRNFDGDMGPMSIWNRALSLSEIQQMYSSQRSRFGV